MSDLGHVFALTRTTRGVRDCTLATVHTHSTAAHMSSLRRSPLRIVEASESNHACVAMHSRGTRRQGATHGGGRPGHRYCFAAAISNLDRDGNSLQQACCATALSSSSPLCYSAYPKQEHCDLVAVMPSRESWPFDSRMGNSRPASCTRVVGCSGRGDGDVEGARLGDRDRCSTQ